MDVAIADMAEGNDAQVIECGTQGGIRLGDKISHVADRHGDVM